MSHHRTNLWYCSLKIFKSSERTDEVSDPLYFLKDQTSHYINICIYFYKKSIFFNAYLSTTHMYVCVCVYIYIYISAVKWLIAYKIKVFVHIIYEMQNTAFMTNKKYLCTFYGVNYLYLTLHLLTINFVAITQSGIVWKIFF